MWEVPIRILYLTLMIYSLSQHSILFEVMNFLVKDSIFQIPIRILFSWTNFFIHTHPTKCGKSCLFFTTPMRQCCTSLMGIGLANPYPLLLHPRSKAICH